MTDQFPGITRAALAIVSLTDKAAAAKIVADSLPEVIREAAEFHIDVIGISEWLENLTNSQIDALINCRDPEATEIMKAAPDRADVFLTDIFDLGHFGPVEFINN